MAIATFVNLNFGKSLVTIFVGVLIAASIMTVVTLTGVDLLYIVVGVIVAGVLMGLFVFFGSSKKK